ncbi:hypothetical protein [Actinokineospora globicatena]|uniref:hypothetical protein n=1 Tax=Actinokineospora globicatena TaxID=103729 RepID=UPI0020A2FA43|nr:hypothetical protein [Actinokineospora globicatena]MCP2304609.1 hypothetical protein [Actinokineospora globicatena]GLW78020.1 hypothetical protein Aglo01_25020 [Actinokineospora globicatena]GLW85314.1 hypothetical protein Aglo02_29540 [Actinokineospora globicatena]
MAIRRALVLGGAGMLTGCAERLVVGGWHVVLPCRHYAPLAADNHTGNGKAIWVEVDWTRPQVLATKAARVLGAPADLLITWLPDDTLPPTLRAVEPLLAPGAPVVEAHAARDRWPTPLPNHPTHHVVLTPIGYAGRTRRPTPTEITEGILHATDRALAAAR